MNRSIVAQKGPRNLNFLLVFDIPQKDHFVTIDSYNPLPLVVSYHRQSVCKLGCLVLWYLYLLDPCFDIGLTQWRWFLKSNDMLQCLRVEHSNDSVSTRTIESVWSTVNGTPKRFLHLDIHPFAQFPFFSKHIEVPVVSKGVRISMLTSHPNKYLGLYFGQICRLAF